MTTARPDRPVFLVGITGHMDLREEAIPELKEHVRLVFRVLKPKREEGESEKRLRDRWMTDLRSLVDKLPDTTGLADRQNPKDPYLTPLSRWRMLQNTPVVVMTSLAPGADTLVAEVALEPEFRDAGFHVVAALPFPADDYVKSTTFVWKDATARETTARQRQFRKLIRQIAGEKKPKDQETDDNQFVVGLWGDIKLTAKDLKQHFADAVKGDKSRQERHDRFRAAGECIAGYAHLMLAIWDHDHDVDTNVGTAGIVEARRNGPTPRLLATTESLALPHGGPLLHLYTHRKKNTRDPVSDTRFRFLQASIIAPKAEAGDCDARWQQNALALMVRVASNLDRYNELPASGSTRSHQELCNRLTYCGAGGDQECFAGELRKVCPSVYASLRRLASLRRKASDEAEKMTKSGFRSMAVLFLLTIFAAFGLDFFAHWHPQWETAVSEEDAIAAHSWLTIRLLSQCAFGILTLGFAIAALAWFWYHRSQHRGERTHDYRAVAEGTRVQFYWHLAGIGRSVSANYMDRQRSELDWIRGAVRSAAIPYERPRYEFAQLKPAEQIGALRCVHDSWIEDQRNYFQKTSHKYEHAEHFWHKLGNTCAIAGLWLVVMLVADAFFHGHMEWLQGNAWLVLIVAAGLWSFLILRWFYYRGEHKRDDFPTRASWILERLVPTRNAHESLHDIWGTRRKMLANFFSHVPLSLAIATLTAGAIVTLCDATRLVPGIQNMTISVAGCLLICGAMAVAWTEKQLHSELAYQYHTMLSLFTEASKKVTSQIDALEEDQNSKQYKAKLAEVQDAVYELGLEALDENAEWLILHRARPMEPVMAG